MTEAVLRRIRLAAFIGVIAEMVLVAPLFIISSSKVVDTIPLPSWVERLEKFQMPGFPLVERLFRTTQGQRLAAHLPAHWWVYLAEALAMFIQATIFGIIALGVIYMFRVRTARSVPV